VIYDDLTTIQQGNYLVPHRTRIVRAAIVVVSYRLLVNVDVSSAPFSLALRRSRLDNHHISASIIITYTLNGSTVLAVYVAIAV